MKLLLSDTILAWNDGAIFWVDIDRPLKERDDDT